MMPFDARLDTLSDAIESRFPELAPARPVTLLNRGRSYALRTASGALVRVARFDDTGEGYAREAALLAALRGWLPLATPEVRWLTGPTEGLPHGAIGWPLLPGRPLGFREVLPSLIDDLAAFLAALHAVPAAAVRDAVPTADFSALWMREMDGALACLRGQLEPGDMERIEAWWADFREDVRIRGIERRLCHGDLWNENLLVEDGRLVAVIDFEDANLGDAAQDFASMWLFGRQFVADLVDAYRAAGGPADRDLEYRVARISEARGFRWVYWHCRLTGGVEGLAPAIEELRRTGPLAR